MARVLKRELGVFGAVMLGLGSIVGTGVFVSIGIAAGVTGSSLMFAVMLAALVASFNGLSSAQLAANHAVSGGTYEYAYKFLNPILGFSAGWMFLLAKSASAATAALGFSAYFLDLINASSAFLIPIALLGVLVLTFVVLSGLRRSNFTNTIIVGITLFALLIFILLGSPSAVSNSSVYLDFAFEGGWQGFFYASALMFVAYTGYGRIATMGEEVKNPRQTIPKAMIITLAVSMLLYSAVAFVAVGLLGSTALSDAVSASNAPLEVAAQALNIPLLRQLIAMAAISAMLGVLLNLILGLSRVLMAMARRKDMPSFLAKLNPAGTTPTASVITMGIVIAVLVLVGNVKTTWSFSAFTVLIYYAITNLAALRISKENRLFPAWVSWAGLTSCLGLAFFVETRVLLTGFLLLALGLFWFWFRQRYKSPL